MHLYSNERQTIAIVIETADENGVNELDFKFRGREYRARIRPPQVKPRGFLRRGTSEAAKNLEGALIALTPKR